LPKTNIEVPQDVMEFVREYATELWSKRALRKVFHIPKRPSKKTVKYILKYFPQDHPTVISLPIWVQKTKTQELVANPGQKVRLTLWAIMNSKGDLPEVEVGKTGRKKVKPPRIYFRGLRKNPDERFVAYISNDLNALNNTIARYLAGLYLSKTGRQAPIEVFVEALNRLDKEHGINVQELEPQVQEE